MKLFRFLIPIAAVLLIAKPAVASSITLMVGDSDWFGTGSSANVGTFLLDGAVRDNRSTIPGGESTATNGAQLTDIYSALYPTIPWGCDPTTDSGCTPNGGTGFVSFPLTNLILQSGTLTSLLGGFQCAYWGPVLFNINGIDVSAQFCANDGEQGTSLVGITLTQAMIDAANAAGELRLNIDHSQPRLCPTCTGSLDYIAFDYFQLDAEVAPVPEPGTWVLVGLGLAGSALAARRRLRV